VRNTEHESQMERNAICRATKSHPTEACGKTTTASTVGGSDTRSVRGTAELSPRKQASILVSIPRTLLRLLSFYLSLDMKESNLSTQVTSHGKDTFHITHLDDKSRQLAVATARATGSGNRKQQGPRRKTQTQRDERTQQRETRAVG
jgi:hypothetical protein